MGRYRTLAFVGGLLVWGCLTRTDVLATDFTHDGTIVLDPSQLLGTSDGTNPGTRWQAMLTFPAPVTVNAGDALQGTISFGSGLLRLRDNGGGYKQVGADKGFEELEAFANAAVPPQTSNTDSVLRFTDVRGPALATGEARAQPISHNGIFFQVVVDVVGTAQEIRASGLSYRLGLVTGGPFTLNGILFNVSAEVVTIEARSPGDLAYRGCISGETESGPAGTKACSLIGSATSTGANSGLDNLRSVAVTADGKSLYVVSAFDDSVAHFTVDSPDAAFVYEGCITGELTQVMACTEIGSASLDGVNSGLDLLQSVALSPDDSSLYTASMGDDAVARFDRDSATGALVFKDCITGSSEADGCTENGKASASGIDSGLDGVRAVVVSPDGKSVYAVAPDDDAIARFDRDPSTGALTYQGCITGETESGPTGSGACTQIATATSLGADSGLDFLFAVAVSPDGKSVYALSQLDDAIARFDRDLTTGALTYQGCITGETESGPTGSAACAQIATATSLGNNSGLDEPYALTVSPDGKSVYVVAEHDDAVTRFDRDPSTGALVHQGCISGEMETGATGTNACELIPSATSGGGNSGLDKLRSVAVSPDGTSLYVASPADDAVARFDRDPMGALTYRGCLTAESETGPAGTGACALIGSATSNGTNSGVDNPQAFAVSADALSLYTASGNDAAVARFDREPPPPPTTTTTTTTSTTSTTISTSTTTETTSTTTETTSTETSSTSTTTLEVSTTTTQSTATSTTLATTTTTSETTSTVVTTSTTTTTEPATTTTTEPATTSTTLTTTTTEAATTTTTQPGACDGLSGLKGIACQLAALVDLLEATPDTDLGGAKDQFLKRINKALRLIERAQTANGRLATANPRKARALLKAFIGVLARRTDHDKISRELADQLRELAETVRSQLLPFTKR